MRSIWRTLDRRIIRDIGLVGLASTIVGLSYGAISVGSGFPVWLPMLMSVVVFAGASQFMFIVMFIGFVASGGNPVAAVLAGLLVNTRHLPFGFAIGDAMGASWAARLAGSHLMADETVAFALAQEDARRRRAVYWACGMTLFVCWNVGVVIGAYAGSAIGDTDAFGLDAAFPAVLLALVVPSLKDRATRLPVAIGVVVAPATSAFLPAGLPVLLALVGVFAALDRKKAEVTC